MRCSQFTNIIAATIVTILLNLMISGGILTYSIIPASGDHHTVFPLSVAISGPSILLAFAISISDTGQFLITYHILKTLGDGYPSSAKGIVVLDWRVQTLSQ
jgi:hypothetical protein